MFDFVIGLIFFAVYEVLSWPLRVALAPIPMSGDLKRMISRVAGPGILCFVAWVAGHFIVPIGFLSIWFWFALAMFGAIKLCRIQGVEPDLKTILHPVGHGENRRRDWIVEGIALFVFMSYLAFRRLAPEMSVIELPAGGSGSEKFDNAMVFWSAWHSNWLPPEDYWLSGHPQAYYYFGHFFWAWIGRAAMLPGEWVITLAMSRLVLLIWEGAYLLIRSFGARAVSAAIGAVFVVWAGNPLAVQMAQRRYDAVKIEAQIAEKANRQYNFTRELFSGYDFWKPSRALRDEDITEYLAWTAILGDFHAHHLSVPWMLGWFALILSGDKWFRLRKKGLYGKARAPKTLFQDSTLKRRIRFGIWFACFIVLGVITTISNLWVAPMVGLCSLGIFLWRLERGRKFVLIRAGCVGALAVSMVLGIFISKGTLKTPLESKPEAKDAKSFIEKIKAKSPLQPLPKDIRSTGAMLARHWGFHAGVFLVAIAAAVGLRIHRSRKSFFYLARFAIVLGFAGLCFALKLLILQNEPFLYGLGMAAAITCFAWGKRVWARPAVLVYWVGSCLLLAALEVFYINDAYDGTYERYNSYFKFSYPIWPLLTAAAWVCAQRLWFWNAGAPIRWTFRAASIGLVPFVSAMVFFGMPARTMQASYEDVLPRRGTLDAFAWLGNLRGFEGEAQMLVWIRKNIPPGTRIAEAVNPKRISYTYAGRISSLAGRPTPLGWEHHEGQWRSFADPAIGENKAKLLRIYESASASEVRAAARELGVEFVVLGKSEIEIYGQVKSERIFQTLKQAGKVVAQFPAQNPKAFIFRIPPTDG